MNQMNLKLWSILGLALALVLALPGATHAAKGGEPGPPDGGESPNNLSLPAYSLDKSVGMPHHWDLLPWDDPEKPELGSRYSYGCDQPEGNEQFSYPNTSCVDNLDEPLSYLNADECTAEGAPCYGFEVFRIYWQKEVVNDWWADEEAAAPLSAEVAYVDWGDALEAVSWTERSVIRVETQPYRSTIPGFLPWVDTCETAAYAALLDPWEVCQVGLQMWHVSGQGITEHWGVRASDELVPVSYNYDSPFQIINRAGARLNLTKMVPGNATCPNPGEGEPGDPPPVDQVGAWIPLVGWGNTCTISDAPYSVEVSVGGKVVYGYNWRMGEVADEDLQALCGDDWIEEGYWRLTFYDPDGRVVFSDAEAPNVAPPYVPSEERSLPRTEFNTVLAPPPPEPVASTESSDPGEDDRLYKPVIDTFNNLTYLDICIVPKTQGGGGGGGGGGGNKPK